MNTNLPDLLKSLLLRPDECAGKVIVVTGAGRGIGQQVARAFAHLKGKVILAELSEEGRQVEAEICQTGGEALYVQTDVSDSTSVQHMLETTRRVFGPVDILVNNAIQVSFAPVVEMEETVWERIIAVNLRGTFLTCKYSLPDMLARKGGVIINMVSIPMPGLSAYVASKQGILGFSQSLAVEVGQAGVQVVPYLPGMVDTPGIHSVAGQLRAALGFTQEQFEKFSLHSAYEGWMPPEHAGVATAFLALRLAGEYHGQMVTGYEILERAGLIKAGENEADGKTAQMPPGATSRPLNRENLLRRASDLREILAETARELDKFPLVFRSLARSGFAGKTGASLQKWQTSLADFQARIEQGSVPGEDAHNLVSRLEKLFVYYQEAPKEMARFTKDRELLAEANRTANQRCAAIQEFIDMLRLS
jgi:NAD(P)-dependent dehydrogenase (short-subunit alcohol dehydrogenase family)